MTDRRMFHGLALLALAGAASIGAQAADLTRGELLFQTCAACHSILGNGVGPEITGIVGQKAATRPGFSYSPAMRASGLTWDEATLRRFIKSPQMVVPGTLMNFPGYAMPSDVDDVIAYLKTQSAT